VGAALKNARQPLSQRYEQCEKDNSEVEDEAGPVSLVDGETCFLCNPTHRGRMLEAISGIDSLVNFFAFLFGFLDSGILRSGWGRSRRMGFLGIHAQRGTDTAQHHGAERDPRELRCDSMTHR